MSSYKDYTIQVEKTLVSLDDLLLGDREVELTRGSITRPVKGINIPFIIDTIKNIHKVDTDKFQFCICLGLNYKNDGEGGFFYYDKDSILNADNSDIWLPDSTIGRWIRLRIR